MTAEKAYAESFATFCRTTNEKNVLIRRIGKLLEKIPNCSVLDIGAGNGDVAIPVSRIVHKYRAIEINPDHCRILREAGLDVVESTFPAVMAEEEYDVVLVSHSLPPDKDKRKVFIRCAYSLVKSGGVLAVITFKDQGTDWGLLLEKCKAPWQPLHEGGLNLFKEELKLMSGHRNGIESVKTHVSHQERTEVIKALAFVYSNGDPGKIKEFLKNASVPEVLETHYFDKKGKVYTFPFEHILYTVKK